MRAKVTALRDGEASSDDPFFALTVVALLELARRHLRRARPRLVLVGGGPGTGKSTLAGALADRSGAVLLSSDRLRKELAGLPADAHRPSGFGTGLYTPGAQPSDVRRPGDAGRGSAAAGRARRRGRVLHLRGWSRRRLLAASAAARADAVILRCVAPEAVVRARLRRRAVDPTRESDADEEVAFRLGRAADPWPEAVDIDGTASDRRAARQALPRGRGPGPPSLPSPRARRHRGGMTPHETAGPAKTAPEMPATTADQWRSRPEPHERRPGAPLRPRRPVVAGVDGSPTGFAAMQWAADEALVSGRPLQLVHAVTVESGMASPLVTAPLGWFDPEWSLREAERQVRERLPRLRVSTVRVDDGPAAALRDLSRTAALVVVGTGGYSRLGAFVLGSTAAVLAASAACPVVVVRRPAAADAPARVLVGVDGSPGSERALRAAADWADRHGSSLTAVHAWPGDLTVESARVPAGVREEMRAHAQHRQGLDVTAWTRPSVPLIPGCVSASASRRGILPRCSSACRPPLVSSWWAAAGRGTLGRLALGSVSTGVLHHAHCPVMVLPPPVEHRRGHVTGRCSEIL